MKKIWKFLVAALVVFYLFCLFYYMQTPIASEIVRAGFIEDAVSVGGTVVRDETVMYADFAGALQNVAMEGETVSKGQTVATLYQGKVDQKIQSALAQVNAKIADLESYNSAGGVFEGDGVKIEGQIKQQIRQLNYASSNGNFEQVISARNEIYKLTDKLQVIQGGAAPTTLETLRSEKAALEQQIDLEKRDLYAPTYGVFTTSVDGLESIVDFDRVPQVTVEDVQKLESTNPSTDQEIAAGMPVAKIIGDFDWYLLAIVDAAQVEDVTVGSRVNIRLADDNDAVYSAVVSALNPDGSGKAALAVRCNKAMDFIRDHRRVNVDIVFRKYSGLKIPEAALYESDGKTGVYVKQESLLKFKEVEVLASKDGYVIVKEDNANSNNLLLYDEVVTDGKNLYDGKIIG